MSKKREAMKKEKQRRKARKKVVLYITVGLVVLGVAALIWIIISANAKNSNTANVKPTVVSANPNNNKNTVPTKASMQFATPPPMQIDVNKEYFATIKMAKGDEIVIQLFPDKAPITVNSFVFLAQKGFFNGSTFHRVLEGFMAQGGDPTGTGMGGPGYRFVNEKNDLAFDKAGVVAMANAGPDTNGSQFFIMFGPFGLSESDYTIFGQVVSGMNVVNSLTRRDPQTNPTFPGDEMEKITITEK
jgi:cyclophilin family peptidyl-prolyl cis-trans isomerase